MSVLTVPPSSGCCEPPSPCGHGEESHGAASLQQREAIQNPQILVNLSYRWLFYKLSILTSAVAHETSKTIPFSVFTLSHGKKTNNAHKHQQIQKTFYLCSAAAFVLDPPLWGDNCLNATNWPTQKIDTSSTVTSQCERAVTHSLSKRNVRYDYFSLKGETSTTHIFADINTSRTLKTSTN